MTDFVMWVCGRFGVWIDFGMWVNFQVGGVW